MLRFGEGGASTNILEVYAGTEKKLIANTQFTPGVWYMLSVVNDGRTLTLYVNGEKDNSRTVSTDEYVFSYYDVGICLLYTSLMVINMMHRVGIRR